MRPVVPSFLARSGNKAPGLAVAGLAALALMAASSGAEAQTPSSAPQTEGNWSPPRSAVSTAMPELQEDEALKAAVASSTRPEADRARDVYRHPYESLTFWGLQPGMTIVEFDPGAAGWWRQILEPYAAATGGRYVPVGRPYSAWGVEDGSADFVLVARSLHNWHRGSLTAPAFEMIFRGLKPGGVLAIEQHRAAEGLNPDQTAGTGYLSESHVIKLAQDAGFVLDGRSEVNANPADDREHAFGVWTLPPVRQSANRDGTGALTPEQRAEYDAIGESDRMTLRLRKPETQSAF